MFEAYTILNNRFGEWSVAAIAARLGMKLTPSGNYAAWLNPDEVQELRDGGFSVKLVAFRKVA